MTTVDEVLDSLSPARRELLARRLGRGRSDAGWDRIPALPREVAEPVFPLSFAQQRLWFLDQWQPGSTAYVVPASFAFTGAIDVAAITRSLADLVERHETLRTTFETVGEEPVQRIRAPFVPELELHDLRGLASQAQHARVRAAMAEQVARPFDLETGPLLRAALVQTADDSARLLLTIHHIACDGWSMDVLLQELGALYAAHRAGRTPALPPLPVQYADYAVWQRRRLTGEKLDRHLDYWRAALRGELPALEIPTDLPRPSVAGGRGARVGRHLPAALVARLEAVSSEHHATLFMTVMAAFQALLARSTGQSDVVVGTPIANRQHREVEGLVGFFVNTLPIRGDLSGDPTFGELLDRTRTRCLGAFEHQDLPFEQLVDALEVERRLDRTPVFQAMLVVQNMMRVDQASGGGATVHFGGAESTGAAKFDLTMQLAGLELSLEYAADLFLPETAAAMIDHFVVLLGAVAGDTTSRVSCLPLMTGSEAGVLERWNQTQQDLPPLRSVLDLIDTHVRDRPDAPAVRCEDDAVSYRELDARATTVASRLRADGVRHGDLVALFIDRSVDLIAAALGVLKLGAAYVPLDVTYPARRIAAMLTAADVRAMVTTTALLADLPTDRPTTLCLDADHTSAPTPLTGPQAASDLMYVLFTSGSTGRPKPVPVTHAAYVNYLVGIRRALDLPDGLSYALMSTFAADLGTTNVFGALCSGGLVHLVTYERAMDPEACIAYFERHTIDVMKLVPSHLEAFAATAGWESVIPRHTLILAGEAVPWPLARRVVSARPDVRLFNNYGPTETTVSMLNHPVPAPVPDELAGTVPLGRPIGNVKVYVVDHGLQRVPPGVWGELCISGVGLSPGYVGLPEETAARFLPNPFDPSPDHGRIYRTGDRVRHRTDGTLEFGGRIDQQIKIRGYRVEPSEIEVTAQGCPGVGASAVVLREDLPGDKRLVAYWVPTAEDGADEDTLRGHLRAHLPDYMVPGVLVELATLPVTPNGKLDRAALPAPDPTRRAPGSRAPRTTTEIQVADAWRGVLEVDEIGVDDNFFDLGGESFRAIRVVRRLESRISVMDLFRYPTVRELAERLDRTAPLDEGGLLFDLTPRMATPTVATVVAVPYGGGSPVIYQPLAQALPEGFALLALDLPGHDYSRPDQPLEPLAAVAERAADEVLARVTGPVVVYGHCVGSSLATATALALEAKGADVVGVVLGGNFPAPRLPGRWFELVAKVFPADRWMSDRVYRDFLRALGGFTELTDPAEQAFAMRSLRHDARQNEDFHTEVFRDPSAHRLAAPILCVVGDMDRATEFYGERYREWEVFGAAVELEVLPGAGHYFVKHQAPELAAIVTTHVDRWRDDRDGSVVEVDPSPEVVTQPRVRGLRHRRPAPGLTAFFVVAAGQLASLMGSSFTSFALGIWLYQQTGSVGVFATIALLATLPAILVSPLAGAVADLYDRRRIMIVTDTVAAVCTVALGLLVLNDALEPWHLYVTAFITSVGGTFQRPAYIAAMTQLVPKAYLGKASGVLQINGSAGNLIAPLLGGALVGVVGLSGIFLIDLISFGLAVGTLLVVRFPDRLFKKRDEPLVQEVLHGWRYIAERRPLVAMVVFFAVGNVWFGIATILAAPMVLAFAGAAEWGLVAAATAGGMLAGGVAMSLWGGTARRATGMVGFVVLEGAFIVLAGMRPSVGLTAVALFGMWFCVSLVNAHWQLLIQTKVGLELQGRVLATNQMLAMLSIPAGYVIAGRLADGVFEPWMADGGALTPLLGGLFGEGPGRGTAVLLSLTGVLTVCWASAGLLYRPLRLMEDDLPDAIPDAVITRPAGLVRS